MITISLCMIVKNEEDVLGRCLSCVSDIADEIIVVDTGSEDRTKEVAMAYTDQIYDFEWIEDFAAARNYSFSKATCDYIMWLDADDIILEEDQIRLRELKASMDPSVSMVMMKYNVGFDVNGNPNFSYYRERLMKRSMNFQWVGEIHEVISQSGNVIYNDAAITHKKLHRMDPKRNLRIFENMLNSGKELDPRQQFYYARELYYNQRYEEAVMEFTDFLNSGRGWSENCINACSDLSECYRLLSEDKNELLALFRSFEFGEPRAEICCSIGKYFLEKERYREAIFWYEIAAGRTVDDKAGGFYQLDCYGYIPYIQMCLCLDRLGEHEKAADCNARALAIKPDDPSALYNKNYFEGIGIQR